jgi:hypothetical protein
MQMPKYDGMEWSKYVKYLEEYEPEILREANSIAEYVKAAKGKPVILGDKHWDVEDLVYPDRPSVLSHKLIEYIRDQGTVWMRNPRLENPWGFAIIDHVMLHENWRKHGQIHHTKAYLEEHGDGVPNESETTYAYKWVRNSKLTVWYITDSYRHKVIRISGDSDDFQLRSMCEYDLDADREYLRLDFDMMCEDPKKVKSGMFQGVNPMRWYSDIGQSGIEKMRGSMLLASDDFCLPVIDCNYPRAAHDLIAGEMWREIIDEDRRHKFGGDLTRFYRALIRSYGWSKPVLGNRVRDVVTVRRLAESCLVSWHQGLEEEDLKPITEFDYREIQKSMALDKADA